MQVNWFSFLYGTADGYGASAEQMILALEKQGHKVYCEPNQENGGYLKSNSECHIEHILHGRAPVTCDTRIAYAPPLMEANTMAGTSWRRAYVGQTVIGFSMWEDTLVPPIWEDSFKIPDAIAVPSKFCLKTFQEFADRLEITTPIRYVPLGVNPALYVPRQRKWSKESKEPLTFLWTASRMHEERKGAQASYEAFCRAFPNGDENVKIILRAAMDAYLADRDQFNGWAKQAARDPRVVLHFGRITDKEKAEFYYKAHALIYLSHGEGFGMVPLQAAATGMPCIVTSGTSMDDYIDDCNMIGVESSEEKSGIWTRWQTNSQGKWRKPNIDEAAAKMRELYENFNLYAVRALNGYNTLRKEWSYERGAKALAAVVDEASERRDERQAKLRGMWSVPGTLDVAEELAPVFNEAVPA